MVVLCVGSTGLPLGTQAPATVPGSTATTTIAASAATHGNLPQQLAPPNGYHVAQSLATPVDPPNASLSNSVSPSQPAKLKKAVKRKAEAMNQVTPTAYDFGTVDAKSAKISTRRESGRQIKKPARPELDGLVPYQANMIPIIPNQVPASAVTHATAAVAAAAHKGKEKLSEALKSCNEILKELFCKKHSSYAWPFYKPVDAAMLGLHDYHEIIKKPMDLGTVKQKMDNREYKTAQEFASDVRLIFTNCYKYNPADHDVVGMARKLQDVFEMRFAKIPDEPANRLGPAATIKSESSSSGTSSESSSDSEDSGEEERRAKLKLLEQELIAMQEKMRKLVEESSTKKKAKKKTVKEKHKKPMGTQNNMSGKSGGHHGHHGPGGKANSLVSDTVGASIASVVQGAGDVKLPGDAHHPPPGKGSLHHMHLPAQTNANSAKPVKSKGKIRSTYITNFLNSPLTFNTFYSVQLAAHFLFNSV